jgi:mono/diheme cytochrome c family protein
MITARMSRPIKVLVVSGAAIAVAVLASACGTQRISVPSSDPTHGGAVIFSQRCAGCHTLSYAGTRGSAANVRTREIVNGPNFDVRCERPIARVVYAIENGGFSGAVMPQNIVVGKQAQAVAEFVAKYAGRQPPKTIGIVPCQSRPIGALPSPVATIATPPAASTPTSTTATSTTAASGQKTQARSKKTARH